MDAKKLQILLDVVTDHFGKDPRMCSRKRDLVDMRRVYALIAHREGASYNEIGRVLGYSYHTTVRHLYLSMIDLMTIYEQWSSTVDTVYAKYLQRLEELVENSPPDEKVIDN